MPQFVLRDEDFEFVRQLVAETLPFTDEAGRLLNRMNALSLEFLDNRYFVERAREEIKGQFKFSIDFEAEVFWVDPVHAWVNGWYLVRKEEITRGQKDEPCREEALDRRTEKREIQVW